MKYFYKIVDGKAQAGSGNTTPSDFTEYTLGNEPQELIDGLSYQTPEEIANARILEIDIRLDEIDRLSIRSLRSKSNGRGNSQDDTKLTELDDEAITLRAERETIAV